MILFMEALVYALSASLGISSSVVIEVFRTILNRKDQVNDEDITARIKEISEVLNNSVQELSDIQQKLEQRVQVVEKLKNEAENAEAIIELNANQVKAVREVLNNELQKEGRKSFWQGVAINFLFFVLGAIASYIVSKYLV